MHKHYNNIAIIFFKTSYQTNLQKLTLKINLNLELNLKPLRCMNKQMLNHDICFSYSYRTYYRQQISIVIIILTIFFCR